MVSHGYPPSVREICKGMDLSSPATVHTHLKQLEMKGIIRKENSKFRTLELLVENEFEDKNEDMNEGINGDLRKERKIASETMQTIPAESLGNSEKDVLNIR